MEFVVGTFLIILQFLSGFSYELDHCVCGQKNYDDENDYILSRIFNGTEVPPNKYPWMVFLEMNNGSHNLPLCGGSIISDKTVLTAAHCIIQSETVHNLPIRILAGVHTISNPALDHIYYPLASLIHPLFSKEEITEYLTFDLAIIIADQAIKFSKLVSPICLPNPNDDELFWNKKVITAGWGKTGAPREALTLMETNVILWSNEDCENIIRFLPGFFDYDMAALMCTYKQSTAPCSGDSGGPLFADYDRNYHIILGVTSMGAGCPSRIPSIFAKVSSPITLSWIHAVIKKSHGNVCKSPALSADEF